METRFDMRLSLRFERVRRDRRIEAAWELKGRRIADSEARFDREIAGVVPPASVVPPAGTESRVCAAPNALRSATFRAHARKHQVREQEVADVATTKPLGERRPAIPCQTWHHLSKQASLGMRRFFALRESLLEHVLHHPRSRSRQ